MMIEEYIDRMEAFRDDIGATLLEFCVQAGYDAKALIQNRIQETGDNADGAQLGIYSTNPLPLYFFSGKGKKAATTKFLREQAKAYKDYLKNDDPNKKSFQVGLSYAHWRELNGRQIDHVDLTFSRGGPGMFGSTGVVSQSFDGSIARVSVSGLDKFTNKKLEWNSERYGDVLRLSVPEEIVIDKTFDNYLGDLARKHQLI